MLYVLYALFFISCIVLVATVLLQPGKTDAGALFTSNVSSAAFGPRGTASVLAKLTIVAAAVFMLSALVISMPALSGSISVLEGEAETQPEAPAPAPIPEQPSISNVNVNANETITLGDTNTNGALIQTPATNSFEAQANNTAPPANQ